MFNNLRALCEIHGVSSNENKVLEYLVSDIGDSAKLTVTPTGELIAFKKGKKRAACKLMVDAHMDEVGIIISAVTSDGFLKFQTVGGINAEVLLCQKVVINGNVTGVIGCKPIHLCSKAEGEKIPSENDMYIDIGASSREEALSFVSLGDFAVLVGDYRENGDNILSKALDDRIGCAVLSELLKEESEYDFYATFTTREEVGTRGAKCASFTVAPDAAIVLEATTAADIAATAPEKRVCALGMGPAISFMDRAAVYDREFYNAAINSGIKCQPKSFVAGGNNAGAIHLSRGGVRTLAISSPCRYIHSQSCMANKNDIDNMLKLTKYMIEKICSGAV